MKYTKLSLLLVIGISLFFLRNIKPQEAKTTTSEQNNEKVTTPNAKPTKSLSSKAKQAKIFAEENGLNTNLCILIDMSIHSGKNRLFIYDFKKDSIMDHGLCAHGCCDNEWSSDSTKTTPYFSNIPESHCSSLGKYKVGKRGYSNWGININYRLHGLESTNNNAYSRAIVLHSWDMIADNEIHPAGSPEGWGCPAVSNNFMMKLDSLLKKEQQPLLMWIFNK